MKEENQDGMSLVEKPTTRNPGRTPEDEYEERVELTYRLLSDGLRKGEIKQALKAQYGVTARTAESYLSRAKDMQLLELREDRESHRSAALAFYKRVLSDPSTRVADRLTAQKRIDHLLGLEVPFRVALAVGSFPEQRDDDLETVIGGATVDELRVLRGLYERRTVASAAS